MGRCEVDEIVSLTDYVPLPAGEDQYNLQFMQSNAAVILDRRPDLVVIGICSPDDHELQDLLTHYHDCRISLKRIVRSELSEYLAKMNADPQDPQVPPARSQAQSVSLDRVANDAPVVNFVNSLILEGIRRGASDIHIESSVETASVRFRIDGVLHSIKEVSLSMFPALSSRIKIMANLNIMERRLPQDGRITVQVDDTARDIRVSTVPTVRGESIVLRLLGRKGSVVGLEQLGLRSEAVSTLRRLLRIPNGLVLSTGPTGSGKTTTLNALLLELNDKRRMIITIEDPVEYALEGIAQIQTNENIGLTFQNILKRILRQDPDILMVGEIRDTETAKLCVRAALTGHMVLSSLHTNDAVSSIERLRNMGVETYLIAAVLRAGTSQRLVRKLCPACRCRVGAGAAEKELFRQINSSPEHVYAAAGCDACGGTGYAGRIPVFEYFTMDESVEKLIVAGASRSEIEDYLMHRGMLRMFQEGLHLVERGYTTLSELEGVMPL